MLVQIVLSLSGSVCSSLVLIIQSSVHSIKQPSILGTAYLSTNLQTCTASRRRSRRRQTISIARKRDYHTSFNTPFMTLNFINNTLAKHHHYVDGRHVRLPPCCPCRRCQCHSISNHHEPLNRHIRNNPSNLRRAASLSRRTKKAGACIRTSGRSRSGKGLKHRLSRQLPQAPKPYSRNIEADRKDSLSYLRLLEDQFRHERLAQSFSQHVTKSTSRFWADVLSSTHCGLLPRSQSQDNQSESFRHELDK